ncbi:MAG: DUF92 domain-containing protein [Acidobacteriota bacterium]
MNPDTQREIARKVLHMSMGLFALCLRWLTPWQAALCALAALAHNLWLFPLYGRKKLERPEEKARGYTGMVGYPAVVLALILLGALLPITPDLADLSLPPGEALAFYRRAGLAVAAAAWAVLAFGDASGALCGILLGGPRLPWNPKKTWAGLAGFWIVASATSQAFFRFVLEGAGPFPWTPGLLWGLCATASAVAAVVESLPGQFDDNLTVPLAAWSVLAFLPGLAPGWLASSALGRAISEGLGTPTFLGLLALAIANLALAGTALRKGWVDGTGFLFGAAAGLSVLAARGWRGFSLLLLFYFLAHFSTYFGRRIKEDRGIAEADGGRRGTGSVFSKGFMPAVFAWISPPAFAAALAVYAADTVASEFGKTARGRTFALLARRPVPPGTAGALSFRGTAAGMAALAAVALAYALLLEPSGPLGHAGPFPLVGTWFWFPFASIAFAALLWFLAESVVNEWNSGRDFVSKIVVHVLIGAMAGAFTWAPAALWNAWLFHGWR